MSSGAEVSEALGFSASEASVLSADLSVVSAALLVGSVGVSLFSGVLSAARALDVPDSNSSAVRA
ncbi:hypothetical protein, partial [Actinotignum timonense]|uniref:hypothetical protein n=1 Tax=Actinotignum timonense TaxID=1870995 RepID=UPI00254A9468